MKELEAYNTHEVRKFFRLLFAGLPGFQQCKCGYKIFIYIEKNVFKAHKKSSFDGLHMLLHDDCCLKFVLYGIYQQYN